MILSDSKPRPVLHSKPREKLHPRERYASGGGLLVVPINVLVLLGLCTSDAFAKTLQHLGLAYT